MLVLLYQLWQDTLVTITEIDDLRDFESNASVTNETISSLCKTKLLKIAKDLKAVNEHIKRCNENIPKFEESLQHWTRIKQVTGENSEVDKTLSENVAWLNTLQKMLSNNKEKKKELLKANNECQQAEIYLQEQHQILQQSIEAAKQKLHKGLSSSRIQKFDKFPADESIVGDRCGVCLEDIELGTRMMRLDCDGQHVFCQGCVEGWFADHNTCPNCRHLF